MMDERYRQIYGELYDQTVGVGDPNLRLEYRFQVGEEPLNRWAGPSLARAIRSSELRRRDHARLREDAKALLAVNFQQLVFVPLIGGGVARNEVMDVVQRDIATLVAEAEPEQPQLGEVSRISGHAIIDSLSRNWANLGLSRFNLWENGDE